MLCCGHQRRTQAAQTRRSQKTMSPWRNCSPCQPLSMEQPPQARPHRRHHLAWHLHMLIFSHQRLRMRRCRPPSSPDLMLLPRIGVWQGGDASMYEIHGTDLRSVSGQSLQHLIAPRIKSRHTQVSLLMEVYSCSWEVLPALDRAWHS